MLLLLNEAIKPQVLIAKYTYLCLCK